MRSILLILVVIFTSFSSLTQSSSSVISDSEIIGQYMLDQGWELLNFEIIIHSTLTNEQYEQFKKKIGDPQTDGPLNENYNAVAVNNSEVKVIYKFYGEQWDEQIQETISQRTKDDIYQQFLKNSKVYTCFQAKTDDIINRTFIYENIIENFKIETKNILSENGFKVISGSTNFFDQFIPLKDDKINIQFAIREDVHANNIVTIGTPILVIEY